MDDARWERFAALGGYVFVVLSFVGGFAAGSPPAADASKEKVLQYFHDHDTALEVGQILTGIAVIGLAWWFGSLFRRMRAAEDGNPRLSVVALLGLMLSGSLALMSSGILSATALRLNNLGPDFSRAMYMISLVTLATSAFGSVIFLSAVCALNYRTRMFPLWTSYLGWVAAAAFLVGGLQSGSDANAFQAAGLIGYLAWAAWTLVLSTMMWRGTTATS